MNNVMEYKGYVGSVEFSEKDGVFYGKVQGIRSLISYEGTTANGLVSDFHEAVDDYLVFCEDNGIEPEKDYRGQFNVRVSPELHKQASAEAAAENITLNKLVENALKLYLQSQH